MLSRVGGSALAAVLVLTVAPMTANAADIPSATSTTASTSTNGDGGDAGQAAAPRGTTTASTHEYVIEDDGAASKALAALGVAPQETYGELGMVTADLTAGQAQWLDAQPGVGDVTQNTLVKVTDSDTPATNVASWQAGVTWGLDRIDQASLPLDSRYHYPSAGGQGVIVYVVDTGVQASLPDFGGRVTAGYSAVASEPNAQVDGNSHGTHVAGTIASSKYGVAKKATIVPVKVFDSSGANYGTETLDGLNWILANHPVGVPAVVNMSLSTASVWAPLNDAVKALTDRGIFVAVAAGNDNVDACGYSPASAPTAFTVGATANDDTRWAGSNYGSCVDAFAPGVGVTSWLPSGLSGGKTGTSMASPHAAGIAALYLSQNPEATVQDVSDTLLAGAVPVVGNAGAGSTNLLVTTRDLPTVGTPGNLHTTAVGSTTATVAWDAPANLNQVPVTSYTVNAQSEGGVIVANQTIPASNLSQALTGLAGGTTYLVSITANGASESGDPTDYLYFTTTAPTPGTPTNVTISNIQATSATIAWTAPAPVNGATVTGYQVAYRPTGSQSWNTVATTDTGIVLTGLTSSTGYDVTVTAYAGAAAGTSTDVSTFTTAVAAPASPTAVTAASTGTSSATVSWTAPAGPVTNYIVSYRVNGTNTWSTTTTTNTSVTLSSLFAGTQYDVKVTATNAGGRGADSATVGFTTDFLPMTTPTGLTASSASDTAVSISWVQTPGPGRLATTSFLISYRPVGAPTWATTGSTSNSVRLSGLAPNTTYEVMVQPVNGGTSGTASAPIQFVTYPVAVTPSQLSGDNSVCNALVVTWGVPTGAPAATGYEIDYRRAGSGVWTVATTGPTLMYRIDGLTPNTTYEVQVKSIVGGAVSAPTAIATATTPRCFLPVEKYITAVYTMLLHRAPDPAGLQNWVNALNAAVSRDAVANAITASPEYRTRLIVASYADYLGRGPDPSGLASWLGAMNGGMSIEVMQSGFISSDEFYARYGGNPSGWVRGLYLTVLHREPGASEVQFWVSRQAAGASRGAVAMGFLLSTEHLTTVVDGYYHEALGRGIDPTGASFWVGRIQAGYRDEQIVAGLVASQEFWGKNTN